jgi:damage-control phosphatase, subfamily II, stand-alone protein
MQTLPQAAPARAQDQNSGEAEQPPPPTTAPPSSSLVTLPVLADPARYDPCTFDYEADGIDEAAADSNGVCLREWLGVFRHSTPTFANHIANDAGAAAAQPDPEERRRAAAAFSARFPARLDNVLEARLVAGRSCSPSCPIPGIDSAKNRVTCISLCHLRDAVLHSLGVGRDIFWGVKRQEDAAALALLPGVLRGLDARFQEVAVVAGEGSRPPHRASLELAVRGVLAGNVFDLGAAASADLFARGEGGGAAAFCATRDAKLLPRPWCVDDLDALLDALTSTTPRPYAKAVLFADNAGSDVLLGLIPLARELLRLGVPEIVLAANTEPTLNDTTAAELRPLVRRAAELDPDPSLLPAAVQSGAMRVVASGNGLPVIDLLQVSRELADECRLKPLAAVTTQEQREQQQQQQEKQQQGSSGGSGSGGVGGGGLLLVLEGMGRGIETNLRAEFTCDALRIGVVKHQEVARCLNGRLYDPVVRFTRGTAANE